jgi:hypothetical protein
VKGAQGLGQSELDGALGVHQIATLILATCAQGLARLYELQTQSMSAFSDKAEKYSFSEARNLPHH